MNRICTGRFFIFSCILFNSLVIFSSCSYKQDQILFEQRAALADTTPQKKAVNNADYQIKPQDILQVRNLQNMQYIVGDNMPSEGSNSSSGSAANNSAGQTYQVEEDGTVALPVIGRVPVVGLTRIQAAKKIEDLYREKLLKDPIIEVKIVTLKVTVLGEIKTQGNYPLVKDRTTLTEMIGEAGGLTDKANEKDIKIIRGDQSHPEVTIIDLGDVRSITNPATVLQNGDIIYVAQNRHAIRNDKLQNFSTILQPALILINTALIIYTLAHN